MSGTSADGIDAIVAEIDGRPGSLRARVVAHAHRAFPAALRRHILDVCTEGKVAEICELNFVLGGQFARAALAVIRKAKLKPAKIVAIGSHGQTIHHLPNARTPSTLQIGEPAVIAELTGIPAVADFRVADMAAGGQGAPLVPFADWVLFTHRSRPRIVQNIGGIANVTFLPPGARLSQVMAFDTGPGNMLIDAIVTRLTRNRLSYDRNGAWAERGQVSTPLLKTLLAHPFLKKAPPKTTGREEFGRNLVEEILQRARGLQLRGFDVVATVTTLTAATIADAYERFIFPKIPVGLRSKLQVILGGGGAKNPVLKKILAAEIEKRISKRQIFTHEDFGIANEAKEALAFAILAHETLAGRPGNVPGATGARRPVVLGKIINPTPA
jgi:anhydro-N-acetylmuramic acid kinase